MRKLKKDGFIPLETIQGPTPQKKRRFLTGFTPLEIKASNQGSKSRRFLTGFTLVEILASVLILSAVIVPLMTFAADNLAMDLEIRRRIQCQLVMEAEMERMKDALRKDFDTNLLAWPSDLGDSYHVWRLVREASDTLLVIGLSGGYDAEKNGALGTDEIMVTWNTQYAKRK